MYERNVFHVLERHLEEKRVTVITGMRRVGKTTALRFLLEKIEHKNKIYLDLERIEDRFIFTQKNFSEIQESLEIKGVDFTIPTVIALDEIQLIPEVNSFIKYYYDHFGVKFIVTGSSSFYLKNQFSESLAGRKDIFEIYPLDFLEFLRFKEVDFGNLANFRLKTYNRTLYAMYKPLYEEYIQFGGFPEVVLSDSEQKKKRFLKDVVNSYIELDVKLLSDYSVIDELYKLLTLLASRVGNKIDFSKIGSILGLSRHKVKDFIHLLEKTYFIHLVEPFTTNADRAIAVQKKVYLADTGLILPLAQVNSGAQFENSIALQLFKIGKINYFQKKNGQEIDFILDQKTAIEVKETPIPQDARLLSAKAQGIGLKESWLIGRYPPGSDFTEFIWGGTVF